MKEAHLGQEVVLDALFRNLSMTRKRIENPLKKGYSKHRNYATL